LNEKREEYEEKTTYTCDDEKGRNERGEKYA
jgi:hypothetical protein